MNILEIMTRKPLLGLLPSSLPTAVASAIGGLASWQIHLAWAITIIGGLLAIALHIRNWLRK